MTTPDQGDREVACAKCGTPMEPGFILDSGYGHTGASTWVEGELGTRPWAAQLEGRDRIALTTYRCPGCGYLESYAQPEEPG